MYYEADALDEYLSELEEDWRKEKLIAVREMVMTNGPELVEGTEYKRLSYGNGEKNIFHLNAQRAYVSLYVGTIDKVENARE